MARIDKEEQARREGMAYAFKIAKKRGIDGLEKELRLRNITKLPVAIKEKDVEEWCDGMKNQTVDSVGILAMVSLMDGFGFGKKRLLEFREIFNKKTECITNPDWSCWDDQIAILKEECGIDTFIRQNE